VLSSDGPDSELANAIDPRLAPPMWATRGMPGGFRTDPNEVPPGDDGARRPADPGEAEGDDRNGGEVQPFQQSPGDFWIHDINVEPGKTYRYRVRVEIMNPIWGEQGVCRDPKLQDHPVLPVDTAKAEWSGWSEPVAIRPRRFFFVTAGPVLFQGKITSNVVRTDIFVYQKGLLHRKSNVQSWPGDVVGARDAAAGVDFATGWTLADVRAVRNASNEWRVTFVDDSGRVMERSLREDLNSSEYKSLRDLVQAQGSSAAAPR